MVVANHSPGKWALSSLWQAAFGPPGWAGISDPFQVKVTEMHTYAKHEKVKFVTAMYKPR